MPKNLLEQELYLLNQKQLDDPQDKSGPMDVSDNKDMRLSLLEDDIDSIARMSLVKAELMLDCSTQYLDFQRNEDAWNMAKLAFDYFVKEQEWQLAVVACDVLVAADQDESLKALAHGIWLGVTYPINPETTVAILQHLIDESPQGSETAAVAAVSAHYIADLRKPEGKEGDSLSFFTSQILGRVAAEHRSISSQDEFEIWLAGNEFDTPESFLPKLSAAVDALVTDEWWLDRDALRAAIDDEA